MPKLCFGTGYSPASQKSVFMIYGFSSRQPNKYASASFQFTEAKSSEFFNGSGKS